MTGTDEITVGPSPPRARRGWLPWALLAILSAATVAATAFVASAARERDQLRFEAAVQQTHEAIRDRLESYVSLLRSTSGFYAAVGDVDRTQFRAYVERLDVPRRYPGIQGIGFSKRLDPGDLEALPAHMAAQGVPGFRHWPEHEGKEQHAVVLIEPLEERNRAALGFDMGSEPVRRQAMERARDTGLAEGSGKVTLVQEKGGGDPQAGFLIFAPVYAGGRVPDGLLERRAALRGYIYGPFRAEEFFWSLFGGETPRSIEFDVYDGAQATAAALLHRTGEGGPDEGSQPLSTVPRGFSASTTLDMAGRVWTIVFRSGPRFARDPAWRVVPWVLLGGLVTASLLFLITRAQAKARAQAEALALDNARLYRQAEAARAEAEVANRAKDEFLATLSHEMRTPLTAILGWTRILRSGKIDPPTHDRGLEVIDRNVQAQARLIEDVLDVSRIITGKMQLNVHTVEMPAVIEAAVEAVRPAAQAKRIELATDIEGEGKLRGDPQRLQQVLWNLLSNAIKFTPAGGRITTRLRSMPDEVRVEIVDTGKGIAEEFLPHVFERFRQADSSSTRAHGGLGIGLALVRHLAELHGGTVEAHSEGEGKGSTFRVILPVAGPSESTDDVAPVPAATVSRASLSGLPDLEGMRVMVVDDEADARDLLGVILRGKNAEVDVVGSVAEALEALAVRPVDAIVSDISMPDEDGYTFLRRLRERAGDAGGNTPAIALTAYARAEDRRRALAAGFQMHLAKPVEPDELVLAVANIAGRLAPDEQEAPA